MKILRVAKDKGRVARKDLNVAAEISTAQGSNSELLSTKWPLTLHSQETNFFFNESKNTNIYI